MDIRAQDLGLHFCTQMWYNISITTKEVVIMPNKNSSNAQKDKQIRESFGSPSRYSYASVQSDVGKPSKERPRPVEKPEKKGE